MGEQHPRAPRASEYEQAAATLLQGLDQNWTSNQYPQAFSDKSDSGPVYTVRTALAATKQRNAQNPKVLNHVMQKLLEAFRQKSDGRRVKYLAT
jgi:hypothetical protein